MTPTEFKSWFAIFCEAVDGTPTPRQWAKIQKRVDELDRGWVTADDQSVSKPAAEGKILGAGDFSSHVHGILAEQRAANNIFKTTGN